MLAWDLPWVRPYSKLSWGISSSLPQSNTMRWISWMSTMVVPHFLVKSWGSESLAPTASGRARACSPLSIYPGDSEVTIMLAALLLWALLFTQPMVTVPAECWKEATSSDFCALSNSCSAGKQARGCDGRHVGSPFGLHRKSSAQLTSYSSLNGSAWTAGSQRESIVFCLGLLNCHS